MSNFKLVDYIQALLPSIKKEDVLEDLRITQQELSTTVISSYIAAGNCAKLQRLASREAVSIGKEFMSNLQAGGIAKQNNFLQEISFRLNNVLINAKLVEEQLDQILEKESLSDGMSSRKAVLLRAAGNMTFISRYAIDLLNYVYTFEIAEDKGPREASSLPPMVIRRTESNISHFAKLISEYGVDPRKFGEKFRDLPDMVVNAKNVSAISGAVSLNKLDPFQSGGIMNFKWSPIYHLRLAVAEWQDRRYRANQEKARVLEIKITMLSEDYAQNPSPALEKQLAYHQERLLRLEKWLSEVEEDIG